MKPITNKTILITGGGTGIGKGLSQLLCARGNKVLICGRREQVLKETASSLPGGGYYVCDVGDGKSVKRMSDAIRADGHRISILINNAAVLSRYRFDRHETLDISSCKNDIAVNLVGPIEVTNNLLPLLLDCPDPAVVNVNSPAGIVPLAKYPIYSASKAGLHAYTRTLRRQFKGRARVVEVFPPEVATAMAPGTRPPISPMECAEAILAGLEKGKEEIWIGDAKILRVLNLLLPFRVFDIVNEYPGARYDE